MGERSRTILLAISLALNVFILGAAAGGAYIWQSAERPKAGQNRQALRFAAEKLPDEQRNSFRQTIAAARRASMADIAAAQAGRDTLAGLLSQRDPDLTAVGSELVKIRSADLALRTRLEQAIVDFAATLSPEQRQDLVEGLRKRNMLRMAPAKKN